MIKILLEKNSKIEEKNNRYDFSIKVIDEYKNLCRNFIKNCDYEKATIIVQDQIYVGDNVKLKDMPIYYVKKNTIENKVGFKEYFPEISADDFESFRYNFHDISNLNNYTCTEILENNIDIDLEDFLKNYRRCSCCGLYFSINSNKNDMLCRDCKQISFIGLKIEENHNYIEDYIY